jgi:hypothetical protein
MPRILAPMTLSSNALQFLIHFPRAMRSIGGYACVIWMFSSVSIIRLIRLTTPSHVSLQVKPRRLRVSWKTYRYNIYIQSLI